MTVSTVQIFLTCTALFFPKKYVYKALLGLLVLTINIRVDFFKFIELFW
jgi:hypothetical protein